ncbi:tripartite tricarboxylate transporter substrate binding protein [Advenella faeciporci]|nr:tripartite tricarboxylate transporter substrate-binding protein [Advenella faeciporci]
MHIMRGLLVSALGVLLLAGHARADHNHPVPVKLPLVSMVVGTHLSQTLNEFVTVFSGFVHKKTGSNVQLMQMAGESGMISADYVTQSADDGSVFLFSTHSTQSVNNMLQKTVSYSPEQDLVNVGIIGTSAAALVVPAHSPFRTFSQLLDAIRLNPLDYRIGYYNSTSQVAAGLFNYYAEVNMNVMPYKNRALLLHELAINGIQFAFIDGIFVHDLLKEKKIRVLATTGDIPGIDTNAVELTAKLHPDFVLEGWIGVAAPSKVPDDVVAQMRSVMRDALADPNIKLAMQKTGLKPVDNVCLNIEQFIKHDAERWRKRITLAKITPR